MAEGEAAEPGGGADALGGAAGEARRRLRRSASRRPPRHGWGRRRRRPPPPHGRAHRAARQGRRRPRPHPPPRRRGLPSSGEGAAAGTAARHRRAPLAPPRRIENLLLGAPPAAQAEAWYGAAQQALNTAFAVCDDPWSSELSPVGEKATTPTDDADGNPTVCSAALGRHLFAVGHTALKSLVHIEAYERRSPRAPTPTARRWRRPAAAAAAAKAAAKKPAKGKGKKAADDDEIDYKEGENDGDEEADATARELGTAAAAASIDALLAMGDRVMAADGLIGRWAPLVVAVVTNADGHVVDRRRRTRRRWRRSSSAIHVTRGCFGLAPRSARSGARPTRSRRASRAPYLLGDGERVRAGDPRSNIAVALGDLAVRRAERDGAVKGGCTATCATATSASAAAC